MANLLPNPKVQFFADDGSFLVGGKVYTYEPGTTTPKATYTTSAGTVSNTNPVLLDSRGEATIFWSGNYKVAVYDADDNLIYTVDNVNPGTTQVENYLTVTGTNTVVGTSSLSLSAYAAGQVFTFTPANTNTAATTLNVNSLGAKNVFWNGVACSGGELRQGIPVEVEYDGTQFQIIGNGFAAPFLDTYPVVRGSADGTKQVRFEVDGLTTATTRVITIPNSSGTMALAGNQKPTRQVFTSGSGTYTTPANCTAINVRLVGGGGGGAAGTTNNGTAGSNTTFSTLTGSGGAAGVVGSAAFAAGGAASGGDINIPGGQGNSGQSTSTANTILSGGQGGSSAFGGAGAGGASGSNGNAAGANSGSGGGGAGGQSGQASSGGGGAGGYVEKLISSPAATYSYSVGAKGTGGAAGVLAGGDGAAGIIIVDEYYT